MAAKTLNSAKPEGKRAIHSCAFWAFLRPPFCLNSMERIKKRWPFRK